MTDRANDILTDYEGICGQVSDVLKVLDLAAQEYSKETTSAIINTSCHALNYLIADHTKITQKYREKA
ncbi:hypothetical protein [Streptococcus dysgalactiae]|uniref:hypothetical protein n=1 Tax=Streptococcus dysgalactiae TaxID=1334 RepID=UPI001CF0E3A1|nr:hypothetical protein [Streptococcus dysgalactiae]MCB2830992.1 hypothetical protein [Streptococcus dysgalactiae subsp. dysgalactiae]MCB2835711.1 hypothetical protein [Streptococcus dysgalactiae subsp. dysgalactiae]MCB2836817.1 hypothetical protein [Streptococcus dysgalactiae subsp. dysgalactiae]MCB2849159.1 hypothetical protein [Streptococcus dysgalactiae subsp. dysgalactiae]